MSQSLVSQDASNGQPLDLGALLGRCMGNFKMVERILTIFRDTGKSDLDQLQHAIESADFPAVAEVAHRFLGAASNVSATGLQAILKDAEQVAHDQNLPELLMILGRLNPEWERFERHSQTYAPLINTKSRVAVNPSQVSLESSHASARC